MYFASQKIQGMGHNPLFTNDELMAGVRRAAQQPHNSRGTGTLFPNGGGSTRPFSRVEFTENTITRIIESYIAMGIVPTHIGVGIEWNTNPSGGRAGYQVVIWFLW